MKMESRYHELHRPQFHFSSSKNWINDPNGLVFHNRQYHLFYQLNAQGVLWGPNSWGHATSADLVHWKELAPALEPDDYGWIWSGSAIVDWNNTSGFQSKEEAPIVAIYSTGGVGRFGFPDTPVVQKVAYSNDNGRTFAHYEGNPVLGHLRAENRDPKVIWHSASGQWLMALYLDADDYVIYAAEDLKHWTKLCEVQIPGTSECPDFFPLPVDGDASREMWVFWGAGGVYRLGSFDGNSFKPVTESISAELGSNGYAAQTWSDIPGGDGRRIQISWMKGGKYPSMPFNQQMSFPVELSLRTFPEGIRICREPVSEIALLNDRPHQWVDVEVTPKRRLSVQTDHDLFRITAEVDLHTASEFGFVLRGIDLRYRLIDNRFTYMGHEIPLNADDHRMTIEILLDRTSMELFVFQGRISASFCFLPEASDSPVEVYSEGGNVRFKSLCVRELRSAWE